MQKKSDSVLIIFLKILVYLILGSFTFSAYPLPIVLAALTIITVIFFITLYKEDYFSFLMQLFICNHFQFGYENGGIFNLAASLALIIHLLVYKNKFQKVSALSMASITAIVILAIIQILSLINSDSPVNLKIISALSFFNLFFLFYYSSKIGFNVINYLRFIQITGIFFIYMFLVSLNQKYEFYQSPYAFFPSLNPDAEYELGIKRSGGTLGNFEFYAEYSISIIALVLPGLLSGSFNNVSKQFYYFCCLIAFTAILAIVLSGTRSSILLLPFLIITVCMFLVKRLKVKSIIISATIMAVLFIINSNVKLIDFTVFTKRSESVDMKTLTLSKILSGEDMNRGDIFAYGIKKINKSSVLIGEGYFTNRKEYTKVHFDQVDDMSVPDYHNLYLSAIVIWGYLGAAILVFIFVSTIIRGFKLYYILKSYNFFLVDLLLGFNILFLFFMINQFKIEFIRDTNYFLLILLLLSIYNLLIRELSKNIVIVNSESNA